MPTVFALAAFLSVTVLFYTGFGVYPDGLRDALGAYRVYLQRGVEAGLHRHPPLFYLERLLAYRAQGVFWSEGLIFLLAVVGMLRALGCCRGEGPSADGVSLSLAGQAASGGPAGGSTAGGPLANRAAQPLAAHCFVPSDAQEQRFARFLVFYTVILTALYSAIPYKTPWCAIQFWQGWILLAGLGGPQLASWALRLGNFAKPRNTNGSQNQGVPCLADLCLFLGRRLLARFVQAAIGIVLLLGLGHLAWQSGQLNFNARLYADGQRNPWVYAHTATHVLRLAERMEQLAAVVPEGHRMTVHVVVADNYWPLPWYLRRLDPDRVGYWASAIEWIEVHHRLPPPHVLIVQADLVDSVEPHLPAPYNSQMLFRLRPEVFLRVYVRQDVWEAFLQSVGSAGQ